MDTKDMIQLASRVRAEALKMIHDAGTGHTGGALSVADILTVLYADVMNVFPDRPDAPERDRFFLSKGHSCEAYYALLADLGFFPRAELCEFSRAGARLIGHPNNRVPGVEVCTGALGHGLPVAAGAALGAKRTGAAFRCYVVMGDGELAEGSIWEAAMAAANYRLDNLWAIVDRNGLQISGSTEEVMAMGDLAGKWRAFGWDVCEADGNDVQALRDYFASSRPSGQPTALSRTQSREKGFPAQKIRPHGTIRFRIQHSLPRLTEISA